MAETKTNETVTETTEKVHSKKFDMLKERWDKDYITKDTLKGWVVLNKKKSRQGNHCGRIQRNHWRRLRSQRRMMTQFELIDRLCAVNTLLTDIVREQAAIMAQHGIEPIQTQDEATDRLDDLFGKYKRAEDENDAIEAALRKYI